MMAAKKQEAYDPFHIIFQVLNDTFAFEVLS